MKLVLATYNQGKVRELSEMLHNGCQLSSDNDYIEVISLKSYPNAPEVVEDGVTYAENAAKKASVIAQYTGHLTLADDAGLEVNALNGAPGINAKRWVGEAATDAHRITSLLEALEGATDRRASFVGAIAVARPDTVPKVVIGVCEGWIPHSPAGKSGFGYDPIFVPNGYDQTFAELGEKIKNRMSHRAKALQQVLTFLQQ